MKPLVYVERALAERQRHGDPHLLLVGIAAGNGHLLLQEQRLANRTLHADWTCDAELPIHVCFLRIRMHSPCQNAQPLEGLWGYIFLQCHPSRSYALGKKALRTFHIC